MKIRLLERYHISTVIIASALALLFVGNILFYIISVRSQASEAASLEKTVSSIIKELGPDTRETGLMLAAFKKDLPREEGLTLVIGEIFKTARSNGLRITSGDYTPEIVKETEISRYSMDFPVEGGYHQIKRFIYDLETLKHPVSIDEVSLSTAKEDGLIGLRLRVSIYFI